MLIDTEAPKPKRDHRQEVTDSIVKMLEDYANTWYWILDAIFSISEETKMVDVIYWIAIHVAITIVYEPAKGSPKSIT